MRIYLLGGENIAKQDSKEINRKAFMAAGEAPRVLIFPWTKKREKKQYRKIMEDYFMVLVAGKISFAELIDSKKILHKKISNSDAIYLPGGETEVLLTRLKKRGRLFERYAGVLIGNSAGTLVVCNKCIMTKDKDIPKTKVLEGLKLVDFSTDVHYDESHDEELYTLSHNYKIYVNAVQ